MAYGILLRHGRSTANTAKVLAGHTPGVHLDEVGQDQAKGVVARLAEVELARVVSSPLERCQETAAPLVAARGLTLNIHDGLAECHYGSWTGRPLAELAREPLWGTVQDDPLAARFPDGPEHRGESLQEMSDRVVAALAEIDAEVEEQHGPDAAWVAVSHGDPIKAALADASGSGLSHFQRLHVDPASISVIRRSASGSMVLRVNDTGAPLRLQATGSGEAVVGGGTGTRD